MSWLSRLSERQMLKAVLRGRLSGLSGEGQPLQDRPGDAAGFRMMAEAGVLPKEIGIAQQIEAQKARLAGITNADERKAEMAKLAELMQRHAIAQEARKKFLSR